MFTEYPLGEGRQATIMGVESHHPDSRRNFILQQGLDVPDAENCPLRFSALMFQPRVVGSVLVLAVLLQSPAIFLAMSAILWWNVLVPRWNPFDAIYNRTLGSRPGALRLAPAPVPRRFAQGMAGTFALAIGVFLLLGWGSAAVVLQVLLLGALSALIFGRFCLGSFLFYLFRGKSEYAIGTLPWKPGTFSGPPSG